MEDPGTKHRGPIGILWVNRRVRWIVVAVVAIWPLYLLNTGPADYLYFHGHLSQNTHSRLPTLYGAAGWCIRQSLGSIREAAFAAGGPGFATDKQPELKSGLQPGEKVPTFYVRAITGPL